MGATSSPEWACARIQMQGRAGLDNHVTVTMIDILGQPYKGQAIAIISTIQPLLPPGLSPIGLDSTIDAVAGDDGALYDIVWSATNVSLDDSTSPLLYQINVSIMVGDSLPQASAPPLVPLQCTCLPMHTCAHGCSTSNQGCRFKWPWHGPEEKHEGRLSCLRQPWIGLRRPSLHSCCMNYGR